MGITGFRSWLESTYPSVIKRCVNGNEQTSNRDETQIDNLYLDMNEICHSCAMSDDSSSLKNENELIQSVIRCVDEIFSIVCPHKLVYMVLDGVAPKAKMHNQRAGLFLRAKKHFSEGEQFTQFDIKPGTIFMSELSDELQAYIYERMCKNPAWKSVVVILSDANVPGEGEHKIMNFIRTQKSHNSTENHVLVSTDSDMILLGLTIHSDHVRVMRQKDKEKPYTFVDLKLLREEIKKEFIGDLERIIDDWIFMSFLAGNDFLPNIPAIEFNKRVPTNILFDTYKEHARKEHGYLIQDMKPNWTFFKILLKRIGEIEEAAVTYILEHSETSSTYSLDEIKEQVPPTDLSAMRFGPPLVVRLEHPIPSIKSKTSYQRQYYKAKFGFKEDQLENKSLEVAQHYAKGLCWMLHYYYKGVPSWDWYYPHYYPPLASTFSNLENIVTDFNQNSKPLKPLEHMLATFPSKCARYLPNNWQQLMSDTRSRIIDFYRDDPAIDPHGKFFEDQRIIKLPFVDENLLFEALKSIDSRLSEAEEKLNRFDDDRLFIHSANPCYQEFNNMYTNNENEMVLSENMNGQILPEDAEHTMRNDQVLCVKYRNTITERKSDTVSTLSRNSTIGSHSIDIVSTVPSTMSNFQYINQPVLYIIGFERSALKLHPDTTQVIAEKTDVWCISDFDEMNLRYPFCILSSEPISSSLLTHPLLMHYYYVSVSTSDTESKLTIRDHVVQINSIKRFSSEFYTDLAEYYRDKAYEVLFKELNYTEAKALLGKSKKCLGMLKYVIDLFDTTSANFNPS